MFDVQKIEETIWVLEQISYEALTQTLEAMVDEVLMASSADTPLANPSAAIVPSEMTPGTDSHI